MSEIFQNKMILKAAFTKEPVFDAYQRFGGSQNFVDFEWKYYQFYHGNRYLTIEKSESSPVTFTSLQIDVLEKILDKLNTIDRLVLRKVSKYYRNLVDHSRSYCKDVHLIFDLKSCAIRLDNFTCLYKLGINGSTVELKHTGQVLKSKIVKYDEISKLMMLDISTFLVNPKFRIHRFHLENHAEPEHEQIFANFLKSQNVQIHAEQVVVEEHQTNEFIQYLNPDALRKIHIHSFYLNPERLGKIMETEQWKKAEILEWGYMPSWFSMERVFPFKKIQIEKIKVTEERLVQIRDILLNSPQFDRLYLKMYPHDYHEDHPLHFSFFRRFNMEGIDEIMSHNSNYNSKTRRFSIPNSKEYFQLEFKNHLEFKILSITRTK